MLRCARTLNYSLVRSCSSFRSLSLRTPYVVPYSTIPHQDKTDKHLGKVLNFDDTADTAFQHKTNTELIRSLVVFTMCNIRPLVAYSETLLKISEKIIGKNLTMKLVNETFFKHFCAGQDRDEVKPLMDSLKKLGVGGILDYAAEEDVSDATAEKKNVERRVTEREGVVSARTYDYTTEDKCDANMNIMLRCIDMAAATSDTAFAAIKITALGKPEFLQKTSQILLKIRSVWVEFFGAQDHNLNYEQFAAGLERIGIHMTPEESLTLFKGVDRDNNGEIDYIEWTSFLQLEDMATRKIFIRSGHNKSLITRNGVLPLLSEEETELMDKLTERVNTIAAAAYEKNVRLLIDAEQTYMQPMINHIALNLQRKYNKERPIIYNTYQCYLRNSSQRIQRDLDRSRREGFYFAAKLVRGAYMVQERKRAIKLGEESPVYSTKEETHENYDKCVQFLLGQIDHCALMLATHNQRSIELAIKRMNELKIEPEYGIYFGQLLGMSDHISFPLGKHGYLVFKYVPYGPIDEVLPYLIRRAQENSSVLSSSKKEINLVWGELKRRVKKQFAKE